MTDQLLVPRELLDDLRDSLAAEIDDRANKFGEDYRPHILLGLREKLAAVDTLLAQPAASETKPDVVCRLTEIAYRDSAVSVTVRADDLRAILAHPAPAGAALPGRKRVDPYCYDQGGNCKAEGWNACLEEVARLNGVKS